MLRLSSIILPESGVIQVFLPEKCSVFVVVTSRHFFFKIFKAKQLKALCINTQKQTTSFAYLLLIYTVFFLLVNHFSQRKFSFPDGSPGNGAFFIQKKIFIIVLTNVRMLFVIQDSFSGRFSGPWHPGGACPIHLLSLLPAVLIRVLPYITGFRIHPQHTDHKYRSRISYTVQN